MLQIYHSKYFSYGSKLLSYMYKRELKKLVFLAVFYYLRWRMGKYFCGMQFVQVRSYYITHPFEPLKIFIIGSRRLYYFKDDLKFLFRGLELQMCSL